jgi:hypothetical protein
MSFRRVYNQKQEVGKWVFDRARWKGIADELKPGEHKTEYARGGPWKNYPIVIRKDKNGKVYHNFFDVWDIGLNRGESVTSTKGDGSTKFGNLLRKFMDSFLFKQPVTAVGPEQEMKLDDPSWAPSYIPKESASYQAGTNVAEEEAKPPEKVNPWLKSFADMDYGNAVASMGVGSLGGAGIGAGLSALVDSKQRTGMGAFIGGVAGAPAGLGIYYLIRRLKDIQEAKKNE